MERTDFVVLFEQIPPGGLERHISVGDAREAGLDLAVPLAAPLEADLVVTRHGRRVLVRSRVVGVIGLECARCLKAYDQPVEGELETSLEIAGKETPEADRELTGEEIEVQPVSGKGVDLRDLIAEQVHLAVPVKPLCSEDCRGLCPRCGADLNIRSCSCTEERTDERWEALKKLKAE